jgi:ribosome-binding protein aMBF1 (putative translation factor)
VTNVTAILADQIAAKYSTLAIRIRDTWRHEMNLGQLIKHRREVLGMSRAELSKQLHDRGVILPESTLRHWEKGSRQGETDWNADFMRVLAETLEMDTVEALHELGFPVVPPGLTIEDLALVQRLRELPEEDRRRVIRMLNAIINEL